MTLIQAQQLMTASLRSHPQGAKIARILAQGVNSVDPTRCLRDHIQREGEDLVLNGKRIPLDRNQRVFLVGIGKASLPMSVAASELLGDDLTQGMTIVKKGTLLDLKNLPGRIRVFEGGHPLPDDEGVKATQEIIQLLKTTTEEDLVLFLVSGGGSALLTAPVPGLTLEDLSRLNKLLLGCGAAIDEINTVRKHLSQVKGGRLAAFASPAIQISLILSDVVGDPLDMIASGPTVPDPTTYQDALDVIRTYHLERDLPSAVFAHLKNGELGKVAETPKPGDAVFERAYVEIIGNNLRAANAALEVASKEGFHTLHLTSCYQGEAGEIGQFLAAILRQMATTGDPLPRPACLIAGGEATVSIGDQAEVGKGGRNQELALSAVKTLAGLPDIALLALATDGNDGPTDAAGAVVTGDTYKRGLSKGLDLQDHLKIHNAFPYFDALGDLLQPGLTQTNVNDLIFLVTLERNPI
jgi:hydroxypyruvate reductase